MAKYFSWKDGEWTEKENKVKPIPEHLKPKVKPDVQFYDVCYYRGNPFGYHPEPFEPYVKAVPSEYHYAETPHKCHIGVDVCARVEADTEEEAIEKFWKAYDNVDLMFLIF